MIWTVNLLNATSGDDNQDLSEKNLLNATHHDLDLPGMNLLDAKSIDK